MRQYLIALFPLCLHCGGSTPPPAEEAPPATSTAAAEAPPAEPSPAETAAPAASGSAAASAAPAAGMNPGSSGSGKPDCAKLKKDMCKVTAGCAWSEGAGVKKECVSEGTK